MERGRARGHGWAVRWCLAAAHIRASALSAQAGRLSGAPVSRRRQGRGSSAAIVQGGAHTIGRVCAPRGTEWRHRRALEGLALRLRRPMQWRSRSQ